MSPRTEKQYEKIRQVRKLMIMDVALELFALHGFENTTISRIAKKAGIAKGLLYNYFESKEELLEEILNQGIDEILKYFDMDKDGTLEPEEMETFINEMFRLLTEKRVFWRLYYSIVMQPTVFKVIEKRIEGLFEPYMKIMIKYFSAAGYKNPLMESILFGAVMDGISMDYIMKPDIFPFEEVKKEIIERYCKPNNFKK